MELGYLGFEVSAMDAWRNLVTNIMGLMPSGENADASEGFRVDEFSQRFFIKAGPRDDILAFGFRAKDLEEFDLVVERVARSGINVKLATAEDAALRRVKKLASFSDLNGVPIEVSWSPSWSHQPFFSSVSPSGFVTGEKGLGHCLFLTNDMSATLKFYVDVMGFKISETALAPWRGHMLEAAFLSCNSRHHSIAFAEIAGPLNKLTTHFELHLPQIDDVGRAFDRVKTAKIKLSNTLGRHTDGVFSFYAQTPSGFDFELGTDGYSIDDNWKTKHMDSYVYWGHDFVGG